MVSDCRTSIGMTSRLIETQLDKVVSKRAASSEQAWRPSLPSTKQTILSARQTKQILSENTDNKLLYYTYISKINSFPWLCLISFTSSSVFTTNFDRGDFWNNRRRENVTGSLGSHNTPSSSRVMPWLRRQITPLENDLVNFELLLIGFPSFKIVSKATYDIQ